MRVYPLKPGHGGRGLRQSGETDWDAIETLAQGWWDANLPEV